MLDDMHKRKIDMADEIFVIDVDGYIGESTRSEIDYAKNNHKVIRYYSHPEMFIDEYGGIHDEGLGWKPNGDFCGECSNTTCKSCINEKDSFYTIQSDNFYIPDKMIYEKNSDGTYKFIVEGITLTNIKEKNKTYKANIIFPRIIMSFSNPNIMGIPITFTVNEILTNKQDKFFSMEVFE